MPRCMRKALKGKTLFHAIIVLFLLGAAVLPTRIAMAERITFPADAGIINVKTAFGAKGDGVTDDTQAIQAAITAYQNKSQGAKTLYFLNGVYLVSGQLSWSRYLVLQGESQSQTTIRLKNKSPAFTNPSVPKAVISTCPGDRFNTGFMNGIYNLTVDSGSGNTGAIGVEFCGHNQSGIRDVTIRSSDSKGKLGLSAIQPYPGPSLFKRLTIDGFATGIQTGTDEYGLTFEHLTIRKFATAAINNPAGHMLAIRDLTTSGTGPAILQQNTWGGGLIVLVDANFSGTGSTTYAVTNNAQLYLRNARVTSGYLGGVLSGQGSMMSDYTSHPALSLFPSPAASLHLPIEETPEPAWNANFSQWANITTYGANANDTLDDSAAIQAAIDSGKPIVYFPSPSGDPAVKRVYTIDKTIVIRNNVQQMLGLHAQIDLGPNLRASASPVFRVEKVAGNLVMFDRMAIDAEGGTSPVFFEHRSPDTLVIRQTGVGGGAKSYRGMPGAGKLFLEDVVGYQWEFASGQHVWARQFNPESTYNPKVLNAGAIVWLLGVKTEAAATLIETREGGKTEVLGATVGWGSPTSAPLFINNGGSFTASYFRHPSSSYTVHVQETRNDQTRELLEPQLPNSKHIPLYAGYEAESTQLAPTPILAPTGFRKLRE
jgi:hypothetical protein